MLTKCWYASSQQIHFQSIHDSQTYLQQVNLYMNNISSQTISTFHVSQEMKPACISEPYGLYTWD